MAAFTNNEEFPSIDGNVKFRVLYCDGPEVVYERYRFDKNHKVWEKVPWVLDGVNIWKNALDDTEFGQLLLTINPTLAPEIYKRRFHNVVHK